MQVNKRYEREISLRDLFFHVLYKWRSILIAALIGAILLGMYAYVYNKKTSSKTFSEETADPVDPAELSLVQVNLEASNNAYRLLLDEVRTYSENAILMKINPYQVWKATVVYSVVMDGDAQNGNQVLVYNPAAQIAAVYPSLLYNYPDPDRLKQIFGENATVYIKDIVNASYIDNSGSFRISISAPDETMAREGIAYLDEAVRKASEGEIQLVGKHRIVQVSEEVLLGSDMALENKQYQVAKDLATYQNAIITNNKAIDNDNETNQASSGIVGKKAKKSRLLYAIIGCLLGAFVLIGFYGVIYLLGGKFRLSGELTERYGLPVYGELNHSRARHSGKGIDRLIEKWEFRKNRVDSETMLKNIGTLIREQGKDKVLLTGTLPGEKLKAFSDKLAGYLGDNVLLTTEGAFLQNNRAITMAGETSAVIVVEELHESKTDEIRRMIETLWIGKTPVIGAVVI